METDLSVDTMHNRPILNTRDEPHAVREKYRRLHLIIGDANMCEYSTALKVGTTQLALELIARDAAPALELEHPVTAVKQLSCDQNLKAAVRRKNGSTITGLDIQEQYYLAAEKHLAGVDQETDWILREWAATLRSLAGDRRQLIGRLDWVTKLWLLETFMQDERIGWDDPWLASLDLEYHNVNPERGLFLGLEAEGKAWRMTTERDVESALAAGPADTRGGIRGLCIRRFPDQIKSMQWERIQFSGGLLPRTLEMGDLFEPQAVQACAKIFEHAASPLDALNAWNSRKESRS
jgi:proteasome accessory factor A